MTDDELKAIEERMKRDRFVLMVEVEALIAEVRRLKGLLQAPADELNGDACLWCKGFFLNSVGLEHDEDCPAYTLEGKVR